MNLRTSRRNSRCSDQQSLLLLLNAVDKNSSEWLGIVRKEHPGGTRMLKKQLE